MKVVASTLLLVVNAARVRRTVANKHLDSIGEDGQDAPVGQKYCDVQFGKQVMVHVVSASQCEIKGGDGFSCSTEYAMDSAGKITLPNIQNPDDCLGALFTKYDLAADSIKMTWDQQSNSISYNALGMVEGVATNGKCQSGEYASGMVEVHSEPDPTFQEWAGQYGFNSDDEQMAATYQSNLDELAKSRADHPEAEFGVNQFFGMTQSEFASKILTLKPDTLLKSDFPMFDSSLVDLTELATEVDWEMTPVKNQGQCGSCWAFAAMAAIEQGHKEKSGGTEVILSEQQLVDCSPSECEGGWPPAAMDFLKDKPIYTTESYPYTARRGSCQEGDDSGVRIYGHVAVDKSESALLQALQIQAIVVAVNGEATMFSYRAGVIDGPTECAANHAVAATGYTPEYIRLKNSWGTGWGESGYMRVKRSTAGCGPYGMFAFISSYPAMDAKM